MYRAYRAGSIDHPVDVDYLTANPLNLERIASTGWYALEAMPMLEFQRSGSGRGFVNGQALENENGPGTGEAERNLAYLADTAAFGLAQDAMVSGDLVLDAIASDIESALANPVAIDLSKFSDADWKQCSASHSEPFGDYFNALCILNRNPVLRFNFTRFWVDSRRSNLGYTAYASAVTYDRPALIQSALDAKVPVARCRSTSAQPKWCISFPTNGITISGVGEGGSWDVPLPTWNEIASKQIVTASPNRTDLIALRATAVQYGQQYKLSREISSDELDILRAGVILEAHDQWAGSAQP